MDSGEGDQKEAIISILEDWAAWERTLEEADENADGTATDQQPLVEEAAAKPAASLNLEDDNGSRPHTNDSGNKLELTNTPTPAVTSEPTSKQTAALSAMKNSSRSENQLLYSSRRERRRAERHDPVARARRQALKVWAADQTRRRSSASEASVSESLRQQGAGSLKEWAAMNSDCSAEATADLHRKGAGTSTENDRFRNKKLPAPVGAPRQVAVQRNTRNIVDLRLEPWRSPGAAAALQPKQRATAEANASSHSSRLKSSHPWRTNVKVPQEWGGRPAFGMAREGGHPTARVTQRPLAAATMSSPPSSSMVVGRGSPWARSPSRETAGGILVKHCFFYGSSGRTTSPKAAAATTSPSFESTWMRQFREEVTSNPTWWLGSDRFALGRVANSNSDNFRGGGKGLSGRSSRRSTALATRGKASRADRTTDLWQEVRSLLAAGRRGRATLASGGEPDREHSDDGVVGTTRRVDLLSFGDRLRYTPLSQGAWLVSRASAAAAAAAEQPPESASPISREGSVIYAATEAVGPGAAGVEGEGKEEGKREVGAGGSASGQTPAGGKLASGEKGEGGQSDVSAKASDGAKRRSSRQDLQSVHAATLAKLRGEIDPFTREELVLRAAEEARGALARERARSASPRRSSAGVFRPSSEKMRRAAVPDSIDYDKVEATLSLIELATRAAGPDAGKQMLQALEGLDKMHQRVSEEKGSTVEEQGGYGGEQGFTSPQEACPIVPGDNFRPERDGPGVAGGVSSATTGSVSATGDGKQSLDSAVQDETVTDSPRRPSRKFSLAVSSSSEESAADSVASTVGIIQTIGNWLWSSTPPPTLSRRNSQSSDVGASEENAVSHDDDDDDDANGREAGRDEFPSPLEESDVSEPPQTSDDASDQNTLSDDDNNATAERLAGTSDGSQRGCGATEKPSELLDSAVVSSGAEGSTSDDTPSKQQSNECPSEERVNDVMTGLAGGKEPTFEERAARGRLPDRSLRVNGRRSSEADKPCGPPLLAKEIAHAEESTSDAAGLPRSDIRDCSQDEIPSRSEDPASTGSTGGQERSTGKALQASQSSAGETVALSKGAAAALAGVVGSDGERRKTSTGRSFSPHGTVATDPTSPPVPTSLSQAATGAQQGGDPVHEHCFDTETELSEAHQLQKLALGAAEFCTKGKAGELGQRQEDTVNGDTVGGARHLGVAIPAGSLLHRDSWFSLGTRPRRGNITIAQKTASVSISEFSAAADAQASGERGEASRNFATGMVADGRNPLTSRKRGTSRHESSPAGRYAYTHVRLLGVKSGAMGVVACVHCCNGCVQRYRENEQQYLRSAQGCSSCANLSVGAPQTKSTRQSSFGGSPIIMHTTCSFYPPLPAPTHEKGAPLTDTPPPATLTYVLGRRRWVSPRVSAQFTWPRPGQICSPKRLRPPGPSGKDMDKDNTPPPLPREFSTSKRSSASKTARPLS